MTLPTSTDRPIFDEIAQLLALGILRLRQKKAARSPALKGGAHDPKESGASGDA